MGITGKRVDRRAFHGTALDRRRATGWAPCCRRCLGVWRLARDPLPVPKP